MFTSSQSHLLFSYEIFKKKPKPKDASPKSQTNDYRIPSYFVNTEYGNEDVASMSYSIDTENDTIESSESTICNSDRELDDETSMNDRTRNTDPWSIRVHADFKLTLDPIEETIHDTPEISNYWLSAHDQNDTLTDKDQEEGDNDKCKETAKQEAKTKADEQQTSDVTLKRNSTLNDNLKFYRGQIKSKPLPGNKIGEMLRWKGAYIILQHNKSYIQWLFPVPKSNRKNRTAQALQEHEAKAIREEPLLKRKVLSSFKMMLDFYGMELKNDRNGIFDRSTCWKDRYNYLNKSPREWLRITQIISSLGELGWQHLQFPWVTFLISEAIVHHKLPEVANSYTIEDWINAVKDETERCNCFDLYAALKELLEGHNKDAYKHKTYDNEHTFNMKKVLYKYGI
ncbi:hypothetical protein ACF0H5_015522 [Mactra antiquata]